MTRYTLITALAFTLVAPLLGCGSSSKPEPEVASKEPILTRFEYARVLMGSKARIVLYQEHEHEAVAKARIAFEEMEHLNTVLSDYDPNSEAMRLVVNGPGRWTEISEDLLDVLLKSAKVWAASDGAFDPTIGPVTHIWRKAADQASMPDSTVLADACSRVGFELLEIDSGESKVRLKTDGMVFDFGGIGKGYAAGRALETLRDLDAPAALVDLGGDIAIGRPPPGSEGWVVSIETGLGKTEDRVLADCGVATSGDLYRFVEIDGERYSHIADPQTGKGLTTRIAVTVIADEPWLADALASAFSVLGEEDSEGLRDAYPDAEVHITTNSN
ncbi:MAG: FAD:protein FMN transferase [Phycisphaera sp.]|nr:MAG: FAD:protein FMN transferase [Phycisphaera sp.]